jgi:hypothetical protein
MKRTPLAICAVAFCAVSAAAIAADPLGFYIGGSVGEADFRGTSDISGPTLIFDERHPGWKAFVGARPIPFLGFEVAYTDFGNAHAPGPPVIFPAYFNDSSRQSAVTAFGVGYLPLPIPFLELYGKLGVARLDTEVQETAQPFGCYFLASYCGPTTTTQNLRSTDFAYGAGVQAKFGEFAVRAEYERINAIGGDPDLLSVGMSLRF